MAVKINRIEIRNFRSIGPAGLTISPGMLCPLIGENNVGKSNVLAALDFIFGRRWPQIQSLDENDYYRRDRSHAPCMLFEVESDGDKSVFEFAEEGGEVRLTCNGNRARREQREANPFVLITVARAVRENLAYDRWTPLGRLLQDINKEFQRDADARERFLQLMDGVKELLSSVGRFQQLRDVIAGETGRVLRQEQDLRVDFNFHDPWNFYRTFQIIANDDGMDFQATEMGMGFQSALTIAVLRAYAELQHPGTLISIEEPEIFLHPQAQRNFSSILRDLADKGTQVFFTTHSPSFVDIAHFDEVCTVRREGAVEAKSTTVSQVSMNAFFNDFVARFQGAADNATEEQTREHLSKRFGSAQAEGFFARKIVLVEGDAEAVALPIYWSALGLDLDRDGISIIPAGSKTALPDMLRVFNEFKIPCYVIFDGDKDEDANEAHTECNLEILGLAGHPPVQFPATSAQDTYAAFETDFETVLREQNADYAALETEANATLGLEPGRSKPLRARYVARRLIEIGKLENDPARHVPPIVRQIADRIPGVSWRGSVLRSK